jgi:hypothetical protein
MAIAPQRALRVDFALRAECLAYPGDDIAEPACQNRGRRSHDDLLSTSTGD